MQIPFSSLQADIAGSHAELKCDSQPGWVGDGAIDIGSPSKCIGVLGFGDGRKEIVDDALDTRRRTASVIRTPSVLNSVLDHVLRLLEKSVIINEPAHK